MSEIRQNTSIEEIDYQGAKRIARNGDTEARCALASREDTQPEILYFLAEDPDIEVRRRIAENAETPGQADLLLARDECEEVRCVLATKISRLFPEVSATERSIMRRTVLDILEVLAADQTKQVREFVSDALKDAPDVPQQVIRQLAADPHLTVCGPILEFSPVLTEEDLLELIASQPVQGALGAISRRSAVDETVSDAIVASHDTNAIADLLSNPSAQIREETLDSLIDSAPAIDAWHAPLIGRQQLPANAARRIAGFVAKSLLDTLRQRTDLDKNTLDAVSEAVNDRLQDKPADPSKNRWIHDSDDAAPANTGTPRQQVLTLHREGRLNEKVIGDAAAAGDTAFVVIALSQRSGVEERAAHRIFEMRSPKGIVAICWKANLSMELAVRLQHNIGSIAPGATLKSENSPDYPLSEAEMLWQIEFFESDF
ncbi:MAG: DUF2336 domain-containing protein [Alphaproteobacteria bacterium]|nr:DUF2336 domain-containing protein [Alphaproteobacteria bacterium]